MRGEEITGSGPRSEQSDDHSSSSSSSGKEDEQQQKQQQAGSLKRGKGKGRETLVKPQERNIVHGKERHHGENATGADGRTGKKEKERERSEQYGQNSAASSSEPVARPAAPPSTSNRKIIATIEQADGQGHSQVFRIVPVQFQYCEMHDILVLVSSMLDRLLAYNDTLPPPSPNQLTRFHSKASPSISAFSYLLRITTFVPVDPCILLILLHYIQLLSQSNYLTINSLTVHRFLISAICCGSKALSDSFATNSRYAKVGGVELIEMNALEREFLKAIDWRLATSGALLDMFWRNLVESHPDYRLSCIEVQVQPAIPVPIPAANQSIASQSNGTHTTNKTGMQQAQDSEVEHTQGPNPDGREPVRPSKRVKE